MLQPRMRPPSGGNGGSAPHLESGMCFACACAGGLLFFPAVTFRSVMFCSVSCSSLFKDSSEWF